MENSILVRNITAEELRQLIKDSIHEEIAAILKDLNKKPVPDRLTAIEAAQFLGISKSTLYGYTCARKIPYYKFGRSLFFYTKELEECIKNGSVFHKSNMEIEREASEYIMLSARKKLNRR